MYKELYCPKNCKELLNNKTEIVCIKYGIQLEETHIGIEKCFACRNNKEVNKDENN